MAGNKLYTDPDIPPFSISNMTPIYFQTVSYIGEILNISPNNVHGIFMMSRGASLAFNIIYVILLFLFLKYGLKLKLWPALIFSALPFIHINQQSFSRPDSLELLFSMASFSLIFLYYQQSHVTRRYFYLLLSVVCAVLAVFVKQSALSVLMLNLIYLLIAKRWKSFIYAGVIAAILLFVGLHILTGGDTDAYLRNTIMGMYSSIELEFFQVEIIENYLLRDSIINVTGLGLSLLFLLKPASENERLMGYFTLGIFCVMLLASMKYGAGPNYFKFFVGLTFIQLGYFITYRYNLFAQLSQSPLKYIIIIMFAYLAMFKSFRLVNWVAEGDDTFKQDYIEQRDIYNHVINEMPGMHNDEYIFITTHLEDYLTEFFYEKVIFPNMDLNMQCKSYNVFSYPMFSSRANSGMIKYIITPKKDIYSSFTDVYQEYNSVNNQISLKFYDKPLTNFTIEKEFDDYLLLQYNPKQ
jgi:hypothetical protein